MTHPTHDILALLKGVVSDEAEALRDLLPLIDQSYVDAVQLIMRTKGKVVVTGMGKSGHIARKIASTLSSTGTLAVFLHPTEAQHGDLGVVRADDVIVVIGKSGESDEVTALLPTFKLLGTPIIAITAVKDSTLGKNAAVILNSGIQKEACPFDLAPTSSTTVALVIGDALAMTLMRLKNFKTEDFALNHPSGQLGRRLLLKITDVMIPIKACPILDAATASIEEVIGLLGSSGLGIVLFSKDRKHLDGILTDGDLRRILSREKARIFELKVSDLVNRNFATVDSLLRAEEALRFMEARERPLNVVPILEGGILVGIVRLHELLRVA